MRLFSKICVLYTSGFITLRRPNILRYFDIWLISDNNHYNAKPEFIKLFYCNVSLASTVFIKRTVWCSCVCWYTQSWANKSNRLSVLLRISFKWLHLFCAVNYILLSCSAQKRILFTCFSFNTKFYTRDYYRTKTALLF